MGLASAASAIVVLAFSRAFGLSRFYDDWYFASGAREAVQSHRFGAFVTGTSAQHWSPLWQAFSFVNAWTVGWQGDLLIRSATVVAVLLGLLAFAWVASRLRLGTAAIVAGMAVLGWHHLNAVAYYSFDCYSQVFADLCTWTSVGLTLAFVAAGDRAPRRWLGGAVAVYFPSLLVKEQGLAALAGVALVALWVTFGERIDGARRRALWTAWSVMLAWSMVFVGLRAAAGLWIDQSGPYRICVLCAPGNAGLMLGALVLPVNTAYAYFAAMSPWSVSAVLIGVGAAIVVSLLVLGVATYRRESGRSQWPLVAVALSVATLFPAVLLADIGELHAHTAIFWFALLVAMAVDGWYVRLRGASVPVVRTTAVLGAVYVAALFASLQINLGEMRVTGERAEAWLNLFRRAVGQMPPGSVVVVRGLDQTKGPGDYSLYRLTTPGMLLYSADVSLRLVAPPELTVVDADDWPAFAAAQPGASQARRFVADFGGGYLAIRPATD